MNSGWNLYLSDSLYTNTTLEDEKAEDEDEELRACESEDDEEVVLF